MIGHTGKGDRKGIHKLIGSVDFVAQARSVLTVSQNPSCREERIVLPTKTSNAQQGEPFAYTIVNGRAEYAGMRPGISEYDLQSSSLKRESRVDEATVFILEILATAPMTSYEMEQAGKDLDISDSALRRARGKLKGEHKITVRKTGSLGIWYWYIKSLNVVESGQRLEYAEHIAQQGKPSEALSPSRID
jgi:hypothetical protein